MTSDVDFVILYCDSTDKEWVNKKNTYITDDKKIDISNNRYRDWDNLKYWFRSVEKYAPWVRKIHFVTDHQVPKWLNINNPKLNIVYHEDFIPKEYLPLYNSSAIEIGLNKIKDLSDVFVYFNDDVFLTDYIDETYYFKNNLPCDQAVITRKSNPNIPYEKRMLNNYFIINKYFNYKNTILKNFSKWFNIKYKLNLIKSIIRCNKNEFNGIGIHHLSIPYLKKTWEEVWNSEKNNLENNLNNRFRSSNDITHLLFRFWRLCKGEFYPTNQLGHYFCVHNVLEVKKVAKVIKTQKYKEICINDEFENNDNKEAIKILNSAFEIHLSKKSSFEI